MLRRRIMGKIAKLPIVASLGALLFLYHWNFYRDNANDAEVNVNLWLSLQHERKQLIREVCAKRNLVSSLEVSTVNWKKIFLFSVDDVHQVLFFRTPKVASSSWSRIIAHSSGVDVKPDPRMLTDKWNTTLKLSAYTKSEQLFRLRNYWTILFVRHPYDRLVSAFLNKFYSPSIDYIQRYRKFFGRKIAQMYRYNVTDPGPDGFNITFPEVVRYITDGNYIDEHFEPISQISLPCSINYDFIGHYETLVKDSSMILNKVNISVSQFPWNNKSNNSRRQVLEYLGLLDLDLRLKLYKLFQLDFELFGYEEKLP